MAGSKLDLYALHKHEYVTPREPVLVTIKPARYLVIAGRGEPGGEAFLAAIGALYAVAFTVKMARKAAGRDYTVAKLEGLWWGKGTRDFQLEPRTAWHWQLLIRVPDWIQAREVSQCAEGLVKKGRPREVLHVELLVLNEGAVVQMLHVGPYEDETRSLERMTAFAAAQGLSMHGKHHEIYLSDPRRVDARKLRTILRLPVVSRAGARALL
jgi:hypothetical protein